MCLTELLANSNIFTWACEWEFERELNVHMDPSRCSASASWLHTPVLCTMVDYACSLCKPMSQSAFVPYLKCERTMFFSSVGQVNYTLSPSCCVQLCFSCRSCAWKYSQIPLVCTRFNFHTYLYLCEESCLRLSDNVSCKLLPSVLSNNCICTHTNTLRKGKKSFHLLFFFVFHFCSTSPYWLMVGCCWQDLWVESTPPPPAFLPVTRLPIGCYSQHVFFLLLCAYITGRTAQLQWRLLPPTLSAVAVVCVCVFALLG